MTIMKEYFLENMKQIFSAIGEKISRWMPNIPTPFELYRNHTRRIWKGTGWVFAGICLVTVVVFMHKQIYAYLIQQPDYMISVQKRTSVQFPSWVDDRVKQQIYSRFDRRKISTLDPNSIQYMKNVYEQSPWIRRVRKIQKKYPNTIKVQLEFRRPMAAVRGNDRFWYLVDRKGVRLPGKYRRVPDRFGWVYRMEGFRDTPPETGEKWENSRVLAMSRLIQKMYRFGLHNRLDIRAMRLVSTDAKWKQGLGKVILVTEENVQVSWGHPPGRTGPTEPGFRKKMANLNRVLEVSPKLRGISRIKLQFHNAPITER